MDIKDFKPVWTLGQKWTIEVSGTTYEGQSITGPPAPNPFKDKYDFEVISRDILDGEEYYKINIRGPMNWDENSREKCTATIKNRDMFLKSYEWHSNPLLGFSDKEEFTSRIPISPPFSIPLLWPVFFNLDSTEEFTKNWPHTSTFDDDEVAHQIITFSEEIWEDVEDRIPAMTITFIFREEKEGEFIMQKWLKGQPWWVELRRQVVGTKQIGVERAKLVGFNTQLYVKQQKKREKSV